MDDKKYQDAMLRHMRMVTWLKLNELQVFFKQQELTEYGKECLAKIESGLASLNDEQPDYSVVHEVAVFLNAMKDRVKEEGTDALYKTRETLTI